MTTGEPIVAFADKLRDHRITFDLVLVPRYSPVPMSSQSAS